MADISQICIARILNVMEQCGKKAISDKALYGKVKGKKVTLPDYKKAVSWLKERGDIVEIKQGYILTKANGMFTAEVARINKTFGFIKCEDGTEIFVPGKFLKGAMPGDTVVCRLIPPRGDSPEAEVTAIAKEGFSEFTGTAEKSEGQWYVRPDSFCKDLIAVSEKYPDIKEGDKVLATITKRGERHADHRCKISAVFGSSDKAYSSALAVLYMNDVETEFPIAVQDEARHISGIKITDKDIYGRLDLRDKIIFTIDGADTKDIDDAVSVEKTENGVSMRVDSRKGKDAAELSEMINAWAEQSEKYHNGDINRDEYDKWRYNYPKYDETSGFVKIPSQNFSDAMVESFKDRLKDM